MNWRVGNIIVGCLLSTMLYSQTFMSYNVENLFYPTNDSIKNDDEFTPEGTKHWTFTKYRNKIHHITQVIAYLPERPSVIGLNEVENAQCLIDLCHKMPHYPYQYIHFDSPDERGIDVAILYDTTVFQVLHTETLPVYLQDDYTRDILYSVLHSPNDTFHIFVVHLPSQLGGHRATQWKRDTAKSIIRAKADTIVAQSPTAKIIVMGDFNMSPKDDIPPLSNQMLTMAKNGAGTHKYQGQWTCLDQFYISSSLEEQATVEIVKAQFLLEEDNKYLSTQPKRTYKGYHYQKDGYSDHLPILLHIYK